MSPRPYSRQERKAIEALLHRATHLEERTRTRKDLTYDLLELAAIGWALSEVVSSRGSLPPELEAVRRDIWPSHQEHPER